MANEHYYYLHTNGDLIHKRFRPDPSDFVKKIWKLVLTDRESAWIVAIEALAMGANKKRILELKDRWQLTDEDALIFAKKTGLRVYLDGNTWCSTFGDFVSLQESQAGFGDTALEALADLAGGGLMEGGINGVQSATAQA